MFSVELLVSLFRPFTVCSKEKRKKISHLTLPNKRMMKHSSGNNASVMLVVMVMVSLIAIALVGSSAQAAVIPPPHCSPEVADALLPRLRRICAALYGMAEISGAVEQYLDERSKSNYRLLNTRPAQ